MVEPNEELRIYPLWNAENGSRGSNMTLEDSRNKEVDVRVLLWLKEH